MFEVLCTHTVVYFHLNFLVGEDSFGLAVAGDEGGLGAGPHGGAGESTQQVDTPARCCGLQTIG